MRVFVLVLTIGGALSGCQKEPVHDVEYWKAHPEERQAKVRECANNPGELADTPNCVNARTVESKARIRGRPGNVPSIE